MKNQLYDWALELIKDSETSEYIFKVYVRQLLDDHNLNKADYSRKIWTVLSFMVWHQVYVEQKFNMNEWKQHVVYRNKMSVFFL
ncbi:asparagine synthase-related protein [Alkalihalobacillus deserti]|uniref:asparagine synthase-related protein n=1 Tax=Alkalihalobacillus deserti TaxID=2879466 RepID=UPI001D1392C6|nr:asparagine synthase-related protein [Alkalihalobacillus deserti]